MVEFPCEAIWSLTFVHSEDFLAFYSGSLIVLAFNLYIRTLKRKYYKFYEVVCKSFLFSFIWVSHSQSTNFLKSIISSHWIALKLLLEVSHNLMSYIYWYTKIPLSLDVSSVQSLSRVRLFATPWIAARKTSLSITNSQSLLKLMPIKSVMPSSHLILCHLLLFLPPVPPSISFRMDWLDLLAVQGTTKSLLQHHSSKAAILLH